MDWDTTAVILAGGDGTRLRSFTRQLMGDERPKQFCPILGAESLLDQTRRRVGRLVDPARTLVVVTAAHARYYAPALAGLPETRVVVQPRSRGTAPAILYALLRLPADARAVAVFPSDHYVADDAAFMARVEGALEAVRARPELVVLLGIAPDRPEVEYGWIEPGGLILGAWAWPVYGVRRFWEKPSAAAARRLQRAGCLWNSFVVVGHPASLGRLLQDTLPPLTAAFAPLRARVGTPWERAAAAAVYAGLPAADFSRQVLQEAPERLAVLPVSGVGWNDLGDPARVRATRERLRWQLATA